MSKSPRVRNSVIIGVVAVCVTAVGYAHPEACSLRWATTAVKTRSTRACFSFAEQTLNSNNYSSVHKTASEVNGSKGGVYVVIGCLGTAPNATATVIAMGDDDSSTNQQLNDVVRYIEGITVIDQP